MVLQRGCRMKSNGTRYSPAFKFQMVLEALKAKG